MRKQLTAVLFVLLSSSLFASQQMVTITASNVTDSAGNPLANGTIKFAPTDCNGNAYQYHIGGGGIALSRPVVGYVVNGAITTQVNGSTFKVADTSATAPQNICFDVTITDSSSAHAYPVIRSVQPAAYNTWCTSGACNWDNYTPAAPPLAVLQVGPVGPVGPAGPTGATGAAGAITCAAGTCGTNGDYNVAGKMTASIVAAGTMVSSGDLQLKGGLWADVRAYGADPTGVTDSTAAFQAALNACSIANSAILFPAGFYKWSSTLTTGGCIDWRGLGPQSNGTQLVWTGASGGLGVDWTGSSSVGGIDNIEFVSSSNQIGTYIKFENTVDARFHITKSHFAGATSHLIIVNDGWVNLHWSDLRFDKFSGCAIMSIAGNLQNASSWSIDHLTIDNSGANAPGVFCFTNPTGLSNPSTILVNDARIEAGTIGGVAGYQNPSGLVRLYGGGEYQTSISNVISASNGLTHAVWSDQTGGAALADLILSNCALGGLYPLGAAGGLWYGWSPSVLAVGASQNYQISFNGAAATYVGQSQLSIVYSAGNSAFSARMKSDSQPEFNVTGGGVIQSGPGGSTAVDSGISRIAAGVYAAGNGTAGDYSGAFKATHFLTSTGTDTALAPALARGTAASWNNSGTAIPAMSCINGPTYTNSAIGVGAGLVITPSVNPGLGLTLGQPYVQLGTNTVQIVVCNITAAAITPAATIYTVVAF